MGAEAASSGNEWLICERKASKFTASGGPEKLHEMISIFLAWANANCTGKI